MKQLVFLHNLIQHFFFLAPSPSLCFPPCRRPWRMMLFALQLLLQGKSNQQAAGLAFRFEKCQVRTCLNPRIICAAVGGLSQRLVFLQWLWWDLGARTKTWGGSEKCLRAVGKRVRGCGCGPSSLPAAPCGQGAVCSGASGGRC